MKRMVLIVVSICLLLGILPIWAQAADLEITAKSALLPLRRWLVRRSLAL